MSALERETTDVVICGCGPTGAMLSAYLGQMNIHNIVLEKEADITTDPRGIALDEDGIRLLQGIGLYPAIYSEIGTSKLTNCYIGGRRVEAHIRDVIVADSFLAMHRFKFIGGKDTILDKPAFIEMDYGTVGCYFSLGSIIKC